MKKLLNTLKATILYRYINSKLLFKDTLELMEDRKAYNITPNALYTINATRLGKNIRISHYGVSEWVTWKTRALVYEAIILAVLKSRGEQHEK